jgi:FAD/FMN-containing dehydrogenase
MTVTSSSGLAPISIRQLRAEFSGQVIAPDDAAYDQARTIFVGGIDRRPAVIIRPTNAAEVARVVTLARDTGLALAVRSGGHSLAAHSVCDGGIVLDLSAMRRLEIDVEGRTAWAQTGLTAGRYTTATSVHGLATGFGDTASVGIGGLTLGGGIGFLVRKHGLTIDSLLAAEVVTADGRIVEVDADQHPDLFWAIRGGGGNMAVATTFRYRLHEVGTVVGGMLVLPATPETISSFLAAAEAAPEELTTMVDVMPGPPMPFLPAEHHGRPIMMVKLCYAGAVDAGEAAIAPLRAVARPIVDVVAPIPYAEIYVAEEEGHPLIALDTMFLDDLDQARSQLILERLRSASAATPTVHLRVLGGALARVPADATAFAHRDRRMLAIVAAMYERPEETAEHEAWVAELAGDLRDGAEGAYVNFLGRVAGARIREAYPGSTWDRLVAIKTRYDPSNVFRLNHNIPPA